MKINCKYHIYIHTYIFYFLVSMHYSVYGAHTVAHEELRHLFSDGSSRNMGKISDGKNAQQIENQNLQKNALSLKNISHKVAKKVSNVALNIADTLGIRGKGFASGEKDEIKDKINSINNGIKDVLQSKLQDLGERPLRKNVELLKKQIEVIKNFSAKDIVEDERRQLEPLTLKDIQIFQKMQKDIATKMRYQGIKKFSKSAYNAIVDTSKKAIIQIKKIPAKLQKRFSSNNNEPIRRANLLNQETVSFANPLHDIDHIKQPTYEPLRDRNPLKEEQLYVIPAEVR